MQLSYYAIAKDSKQCLTTDRILGSGQNRILLPCCKEVRRPLPKPRNPAENGLQLAFGAICHVMNVKNKTCLFCLKQRQILVDDSCTAKAIQKIYSITLPTDECRLCIECHFNIGRIREFKQSIDRCSDFEVDSCFVCKSENTVSEPGVDRVVDYLLKQCTTIDIGNTDTVRACTTCMYLLEICIKYEKLARNYINCQRFCKQFTTIRECNVALGRIDLDTLGDICASFESNRGRGKKGKKRGRGSWGGREENASKRSKKEDESVLPVMLTKLTPTMTPAGRPGRKSLSPDSSSVKKGKAKPNSKIFIKIPVARKQRGKKQRGNRISYEVPHSPCIDIPSDPSVEDLNRIFNVELRPLFVRIEQVDLSSYLNRTISHDKTTLQPRKLKKEEFIGLDEEDVVELQQNNTSISSVGKRKSILVTERIESPNSAKKKVKFSDSPSIKYVDKLNFSEDDDNDSEDHNDADYEGSKYIKKKSPKVHNGGGTPENGKARRGRPKKIKDIPEEDKKTETVSLKEDSIDLSEKKNDETDIGSTNDETNKTYEKNEIPGTSEKDKTEKQPITDKEKIVIENGNANEEEKLEEVAETSQSVETAQISVLPSELSEAAQEDAPMDTTDQVTPQTVEESKQNEIKLAVTVDEEMKEFQELDKSSMDVEMTESKSPSEIPEDVEMKETSAVVVVSNHTEYPERVAPENEKKDVPQESAATEFEASDREDEIEQVKQCLNNILGEQISDSEPSQMGDQSSQEEEKTESISKVKNEPEVYALASESFTPPNQKHEPESSQVEKSHSSATQLTPETPDKKNQTFSSLDDVDDISDDDGILDQLDLDGEEGQQNNRKQSPDLPPLGEDSL